MNGPAAASRPWPLRGSAHGRAPQGDGPRTCAWQLSLDVDLDDLFGELVDAVDRPVAADDVVVAQPVEIAAIGVGRMHDDVHVLPDRPRLVAADERPLDQVVALAV